MRFGQIESFDKETRQGFIVCFDAPKPIPFRDDKNDWELGTLIQFDVAVFGVNIRKNTTPSPISSVYDTPSSAANAARGTFNPAYHRQAGDAAAIEAQREKK